MLRPLFYGTEMTSAWSERNQAFANVTLEQVNGAVARHLNLNGFVEVLADMEGHVWTQ